MAVTNAYHILHTHTFDFRSSRAKYISNEMFCSKQYSFCKNHLVKIVMKSSWKIRMAKVLWKCTHTHTHHLNGNNSHIFLEMIVQFLVEDFPAAYTYLIKVLSLIATNNGISFHITIYGYKYIINTHILTDFNQQKKNKNIGLQTHMSKKFLLKF